MVSDFLKREHERLTAMLEVANERVAKYILDLNETEKFINILSDAKDKALSSLSPREVLNKDDIKIAELQNELGKTQHMIQKWQDRKDLYEQLVKEFEENYELALELEKKAENK